MPQIGKKYFVIAHAYHHYICEVTDITPKFLITKDCIKIMSDSAGWEATLLDGLDPKKTSWQCMPDGTELPYGSLPIIPWNHPIPKRKKIT